MKHAIMSKVWKLKSKISEDIADKILNVLSSNPHPNPLSRSPHSTFGRAGNPDSGEGGKGLLAQLLYNRGLTETDKIEEFLNPQYERLHNPFLFKDMEKALERIWQGINQNQKITIYSDYDADAVTANAVLRQTFRHLGHQNIDSYIPDRFSEGYGVNVDALSKIKDEGTKVIITVDCGTNSVEATDFCKVNGIDLIITDHHEIIGPLPNAYALINPKNSADNYPDQNITGVGVAFKMACAILNSEKRKAKSEKYIEGWEKWLLDLVAIGTVADCHELLGENRILVKYGLKVLEKTRWVGLKALITSSALDFSARPPDTYTLGFILAPRLNAAGRLEHADASLDLLLEGNFDEAKIKALDLESVNRRRQDITARILSEAREQALLLKDRKVLVLMDQNWHKGVVGLVAGKIAEEFYRPTIVLQQEELEATGSARSIGGFNIVEALRYSSNHLLRFGGHKAAAGLTLQPDNFDNFYLSLLDYADQNLSDADLSPSLELEAELDESQLSMVNCQLLSQLEPFGVGNPRPKFLIKNAKVLSQRSVGTNGQHLQMQIQVGERIIPAIAFNFRPIDASQNYDLACELMEDGWNGRKQVKVKIVDIHLSTK